LTRSNHFSATTNRQFAAALGRAFAGATIFTLPLLMTMEMWWFGHYLQPWRLAQLSLANIAMLYGMSRVAGFEASHNWIDDVLDAFAAYGVAAITSAAILFLLGVIGPDMALREIAGKIAVQAVPASFGAMIGAKLMGEGDEIEKQERWRTTPQGTLFLTLAGALFLSFTVAPTEEMILISFQMSPWHALALILLSILLLHAILYLVEFRGQQHRSGHGHRLAFIVHTLPSYGIAVAASCYILWTFGRLSGLDLPHVAMSVAVLAFPAALGAAIARVVI
jgi:putative integral membrane protein (TIGR02587 family)